MEERDFSIGWEFYRPHHLVQPSLWAPAGTAGCVLSGRPDSYEAFLWILWEYPLEWFDNSIVCCEMDTDSFLPLFKDTSALISYHSQEHDTFSNEINTNIELSAKNEESVDHKGTAKNNSQRK